MQCVRRSIGWRAEGCCIIRTHVSSAVQSGDTAWTGIGGDVGAATDEPVYARAPSSRAAAAQSGDTAWTGIGGDVGAATDEPVYARAPSSRARFELVAYRLCLCHYDMVQLGLITLVSSPSLRRLTQPVEYSFYN